MDIEDTIKRVRTGDTTALKKLIEAYSPMLRKVCFNITHEDEDALNDLVQVAFIRAYYSPLIPQHYYKLNFLST